MSISSRLDRAFAQASVLPLNKCSKYALVSDCHRGVGTSSDNFSKNQHLYFAAMEHYYRDGFTYIELGDGEELWENRCMHNITDIHSDVYEMFEKYKRRNRLYLIYGNHNIVMKKKSGLPGRHYFICKRKAGTLPVFNTRTPGEPAQFRILAAGAFSCPLCMEPARKYGCFRSHQRRKKLYGKRKM